MTYRLRYRPPLDWEALLGFLAPRAIPGVEIVDGDVYRRTCAGGVIEVAPGRGAALTLRAPSPSDPAALVSRARRLFDLDADPVAIGDYLRRSPRLASLVALRPGLRVPGAWDPFETAVRAVLGQQISVRAATTLAGRLVQAFGEPVRTSHPELTHRFPDPRVFAEADVSTIGLPRARAATIRALAASVAAGEPLLAGPATAGRLRALPGIGPWTVAYVAMRALGDHDAFPAGDLGLRRALARGTRLPSDAAVARAAERWRPWRSYAALHLWIGGDMTTLDIAKVESPLGTLVLAVHGTRLCALEFATRWPRRRAALVRRFGKISFRPSADPAGVASRVRAYFAGAPGALDDIPVDAGGTAFQRRVWHALRRIPPGRTTSYAALAGTIGRPRAVRAVAAANGANPVAIVVPCHRVIGADGSLTGYSGGLARKRWLLAHEEVRP
jgi:O-6-methylguanine DNA methyltransferase